MTNYARIARTDDETFSDEAEFVARRRDELVEDWITDKAKVTEAIADALSGDGEDFFAGLMANLLIRVESTVCGDYRNLSSAAAEAWSLLRAPVFERLERDAETAAQAEYDNRLTGPEGDL